MSLAWQELLPILENNQSFLLTSHIRPDCDALGSELGLAGLLESKGKTVTILNGQETPPSLKFIDPKSKIQALGIDIQPDAIPPHDVFVVLDTSAWAQLGPMGDVLRASAAQKIIIDHHVSQDDLGATPYKNTSAEATGRLIVELANEWGIEMTAEIGKPLFAALVTDTGWLRFPSTNSGSYRAAAQLVDAGVSPSEIYAKLYEQESLGRCRLRGLIMSRMATENDGRLIHSFVRKDDYQATGAHPSDTEDAINQGLAVAGTEVATILVEQPTGGFKLSFRSRCHVDCSQVASQFGGGGHKAAAGAFIDEPFESAQPKVVKALSDALLKK